MVQPVRRRQGSRGGEPYSGRRRAWRARPRQTAGRSHLGEHRPRPGDDRQPKGYALETPLSAEIPLEKRTVLRFFGAEVVELDDSLCPAPGAPEGAIARARETGRDAREHDLLDQYTNEANPGAHFRTTGPEIWRQTDGRVTHFVAGLGTCGTITGTGRFLKQQNPGVKVLGVYPEDGHDIPGVRSKRQLAQTSLYFPHEYDGEAESSDREAYDLCLRLNREESIIAGPSSGMALAGAIRMVPDEPGVVAVVIFPDNIFKYASSVCRHFPQWCPATAANKDASAPSAGDKMLATLLENLKNPYDSVAVTELVAELGHEPRPLVVDVRTAEQFAAGHLRGAVNIPQADLPARAAELPDDRDAPIVMVCSIGRTSKETVLYLKSLGYRHARNLKGGVTEWIRKGQKIETDTPA